MLLVIIICIVIVLLVGASWYFFYVSLNRGGLYRNTAKKYTGAKGQEKETPQKAFYIDREWWENCNKEEIQITSFDGLLLKGTRITNKGGKHAAVLCHGYGASAERMAGFAKLFYDQGLNIIVPDCRAHGRSQGSYIGMGWLDRLDFLKWISQTIEWYGGDTRIVVMGISMGGATACALSGEALPENVKCMIADCAYTRVWDIFAYQLKTQYGLPAHPFMDIAGAISRVLAGYAFSEGDMAAMVKKSKIPMLFIHGEQDRFVPIAMAYQLYEAAPAGGGKEIFIVPGAAHGLSFRTDRASYTERVGDFIHTHLK